MDSASSTAEHPLAVDWQAAARRLFDEAPHRHGLPRTFRPVLTEVIARVTGRWRPVRGTRPAWLVRVADQAVGWAGPAGSIHAAMAQARDAQSFSVEGWAALRLAALARAAGALALARRSAAAAGRRPGVREAGNALAVTAAAAETAGNLRRLVRGFALWRACLGRVRVHRETPGRSHGRAAPLPGLVAARVLRYQAGILTSRVPGLPLPDPEFVHEMRVASRRLRAALRTFRSVLRSDEAARLRSAATTAARLLGTVRDADVQAARLRRLPGRSSAPIRVLCDGLLRRERRRRSRALAVARRRLDAAWVLRFSGVLARVLRRLEREHGPAGGRDASFSRLWRPAQRSLRRVLRRVARQETCLSRMTSGEQHDLRVALKRVRYAAECLEPVIGRRVFGLLRACVRLQGFLGDAHDADLLAARLGRATGPGAAARAALRRSLSDLRRRRIKAADRAWPGFCRRSKAVLRRLA